MITSSVEGDPNHRQTPLRLVGSEFIGVRGVSMNHKQTVLHSVSFDHNRTMLRAVTSTNS